MAKDKRIKLSRETNARVNYRGMDRQVVVELDRDKGLISLRLKGCKKRRVYSVVDLFHPGKQMSLPL